MEESEVIEGWYDVDSTRCVLFEVFVFNGDFVITKGLFSFRLSVRLQCVEERENDEHEKIEWENKVLNLTPL